MRSDDWDPAAGDQLRWCHERLGIAAGGPDHGDGEVVRAMPMVLHVPKVDPPTRTAVLEAAGTAVARFCFDSRVAPGGGWHTGYAAWTDARMRKIARRARGAQWRSVAELPGVGAHVSGAQARAYEPGPVDAVDSSIARLQIGGTELERDDPGPVPAGIPVVWLDAGLEMSLGKAAAQVGHGVMLLAAAMPAGRVVEWVGQGLPVAVREAGPRRWSAVVAEARLGRPGVASVVDAGYTEVAPGSVTVVAADPRSR